jgi:predicted helicase
VTAIGDYLKQIQRELKRGNATEHSYRPALKALLESLANGITATNEPKREECGAPDLIVLSGQTPLGYVETKDVGANLIEIETDARRTKPKTSNGEQLKRYQKSLGSVLLTDYLEFRWYLGGEHRLTARAASIARDGKVTLDSDGSEEVVRLLHAFITERARTVESPKDLAARMAALARLIRQMVIEALADEGDRGHLHEQMKGFREVLIHSLERDEFADMYAQTIAYGFFAARCYHTGPGRFTRDGAANELPKTNPFLRRTFAYITGVDLHTSVSWVVDDLVELLNHADIQGILADFGRRTRQEDPVVHFYETFLAAYDPKMRESRGVYYTPEPVVSYIVRSVDEILKRDFGLSDGIADTTQVKIKSPDGEKDVHKVLILDPAAGTGTFLYKVIRQIYEHETEHGRKGAWSQYVSRHLLPRLFGFELLMAPYTVAHMKLGLELKDSGYDFSADERLRVYLTNTLDEAKQVSDALFAGWIAEEANAAGDIKKDVPVMVVLGNPPYSGHSANTGEWIEGLLRGIDTLTGRPSGNYFEVDGKGLGERNPKWLNDDYVKFIRFAQWRIEQTGYGILAFITNHGYLDNPTFRGMRQSLLTAFDRIYILDLHGNAKKKEKAPDGSKDENVFDIQQGVSIGIFVKAQQPVSGEFTPRGAATCETARIQHAHLWGLRDSKYEWLASNSVASTEWKILTPRCPFYLFTPQSDNLLAEYEFGIKITDAFIVNGVGMTTARDHIVIDFEEPQLLARAKAFRDATGSDEEVCRLLGIPLKKGWNISRARKLLKAESSLRQFVQPVLYRPFDERLIFYHDSLVWRTVKQVMHHMLAGKNLGLCTTRSTEIGRGWEHVFCTRELIQHHTVSLKEVNYLYPLYSWPTDQSRLEVEDWPPGADGRRPNLRKRFVEDIARRLSLTFASERSNVTAPLKGIEFGPEDIFHYMYSVFHSPTYRNRYAELLKIDFPRLPLTSNLELFRELCLLGEQLVALHLMGKHGPSITEYNIKGTDTVDKVRYSEPKKPGAAGQVWVNSLQYFDGVPQSVWEFHIGGYQVCEKWLKDRKGRTLTYDDITHYQHIVSAISETIRLMAEIDATIARHGGWPLK